jgi:hypothetical protein
MPQFPAHGCLNQLRQIPTKEAHSVDRVDNDLANELTEKQPSDMKL